MEEDDELKDTLKNTQKQPIKTNLASVTDRNPSQLKNQHINQPAKKQLAPIATVPGIPPKEAAKGLIPSVSSKTGGALPLPPKSSNALQNVVAVANVVKHMT